jgi:hypothetical protein
VLEGSIQCLGRTAFGLRLSVDAWPTAATARLFALPAGAACQDGTIQFGGAVAASLQWTLAPGTWQSNPCALEPFSLAGQAAAAPGRDSFTGATAWRD